MSLRKIGQWIFGLPDCPETATAAVVNSTGTFAWWCGTYPEDLRPSADGAWNAHDRASGDWDWPEDFENNRLDASDWRHSLIIREVLNPVSPRVMEVSE